VPTRAQGVARRSKARLQCPTYDGHDELREGVVAPKTVSNWFGDLVFHPAVVAEVDSLTDIASVLKKADVYPSPIRPAGSRHSTTPCATVEGGTLLDMRRLDRIIEIGADFVTAEAGALYLDVSQALAQHGLQHHVNTEIGNLTLGSAACAGTKDASMPGEFGQVNSYVSAVKMITPSGDLLEVTEADPELLSLVRSSYGLFGVIYEVTLRARPIQPMAVRHETFDLDEFAEALPELLRRGESVMLYLFPFDDAITIEFRRYVDRADGERDDHVWELRNFAWKNSTPRFCHDVEQSIENPRVRYAVIDGFNKILRFKLNTLIRSDNTLASQQTIRYPEVSDESRYTFSLWAFPVKGYAKVLRDYFAFCRRHYDEHGYRTNMPNVGYHILEDKSSWFSYAHEGPVFTIDPVSTANEGWTEFLAAYNEFAIARGGKPLFNQTPGITRAQARSAFGQRLDIFEARRRELDPDGRLLNQYFADLLA
jgi:FAD/FMN-containing dehydrogenase